MRFFFYIREFFTLAEAPIALYLRFIYYNDMFKV